MIHFTTEKGIDENQVDEELEKDKEIKKLKAQLKATTDRMEFQEELIAEIAMKVY